MTAATAVRLTAAVVLATNLPVEHNNPAAGLAALECQAVLVKRVIQAYLQAAVLPHPQGHQMAVAVAAVALAMERAALEQMA